MKGSNQLNVNQKSLQNFLDYSSSKGTSLITSQMKNKRHYSKQQITRETTQQQIKNTNSSTQLKPEQNQFTTEEFWQNSHNDTNKAFQNGKSFNRSRKFEDKDKQKSVLLNIRCYEEAPKYAYLKHIDNKFMMDIMQGRVTIPEQSKSIQDLLNRPTKTERKQKQKIQMQRFQQARLRQIKEKKNSVLTQLEKLYEEENQIRQTIITKQKFFTPNSDKKSFSSQKKYLQKHKLKRHGLVENRYSQPRFFPQSSSCDHIGRSFFSPEEKHKIRSIFKSRNSKEEQYQNSIKALLQKEEAEKKREQILQKERLEKAKIERRQALIKKHQQKQEQRRRLLEGARQHQRKVLSQQHHYKYLELLDEDIAKEKQQHRYQQIVLLKQKQKMKLDFEQIKIHQEKYKEIKQQRKVEEKEKLQKYIRKRKQQEQNLSSQHSKSLVTRLSIVRRMENEQDELKESQAKKNKQKFQFRTKMKDYYQQIKNKHKPKSSQASKFKMNTKSQSLFSSSQFVNKEGQDQHQPRKKMSIGDIKKEGNKYLQISKSLAQRHKTEPSESSNTKDPINNLGQYTHTTINIEDSRASNGTKYHNYLSEVREMNEKQKIQEEQKLLRILKKQNSNMKQLKAAMNILNRINSTKTTTANSSNNNNNNWVSKQNSNKSLKFSKLSKRRENTIKVKTQQDYVADNQLLIGEHQSLL